MIKKTSGTGLDCIDTAKNTFNDVDINFIEQYFGCRKHWYRMRYSCQMVLKLERRW